MAIRSRTEVNGTIAIIELKGVQFGDKEIDRFRETVADFLEQGIKCLVVDLRKVNYFNSSGLGALIAAHTTYSKIGGEVKLAGLSNNVQHLLIMTKLIDVFDVFDDIDEAIDGFLKMKSIK